MSDQLCQTHWFELSDASALSCYVLLYYDYFLTLPWEIDRFWHPGPHSWASIVFFANRYMALLGHVPFLYSVYAPCKTVHIQPLLIQYHGILMLLLHVLTAVLLMMRVYALYFRNNWVLAIVALEAVATIAIGCWVLTRPLGVGGTDIQNLPKSTRYQTAVAFSGLLVFDFTVFTLSTYRSINLGRQTEPFLNRLLVDGIMYYGVTWSVNLVNVVVLAAADSSVKLATPVIANVLSVIMVSRLMINLYDPMLREPTVRGGTDGTDTNSLTGYISTFIPDGIIFAPSTRPVSSMELGTLDLPPENAPGSIPHCDS